MCLLSICSCSVQWFQTVKSTIHIKFKRLVYEFIDTPSYIRLVANARHKISRVVKALDSGTDDCVFESRWREYFFCQIYIYIYIFFFFFFFFFFSLLIS